MTLDEAAAILREMRETAAPRGEMDIQAILFGIKYRDQLEYMSLAELSRQVGNSPETCKNRCNHGNSNVTPRNQPGLPHARRARVHEG